MASRTRRAGASSKTRAGTSGSELRRVSIASMVCLSRYSGQMTAFTIRRSARSPRTSTGSSGSEPTTASRRSTVAASAPQEARRSVRTPSPKCVDEAPSAHSETVSPEVKEQRARQSLPAGILDGPVVADGVGPRKFPFRSFQRKLSRCDPGRGIRAEAARTE